LLKFSGLIASSWALSWCLYRLHGIRLIGPFEGRPRGKAAPANLCADPAAEVWGVLYKITRRDLVRLDATEGVPWWRYRPLWLDAEDISGTALQAVAYIAQGDEDDRNPSLRYLTLLQEGARAHGLPEHYIRFLEQVEHAR
jgi:cation transport regulator ChaC